MISPRPTSLRLQLASLAAGATLFLAPAVGAAQGPGPVPELPPGCGIPTVANSPVVVLFVNNVCFNLSELVRPGEQPGKTWVMETGVLQLGDAQVRIFDTEFNSDPFINFGMSTTNVGPGPTTFAFLFGTPIVEGFYGTAGSSAGLTLTAGALGSTVDNSAVYPTYVSGYGTFNGAVVANLGVDLGTEACVDPETLGTTTCNQGTTTNTFPPVLLNDLHALLTYTQTDVGSVASWSGQVRVDAVVIPEPTTVVLMFTGLLALGGVSRLRRRTS